MDRKTLQIIFKIGLLLVMLGFFMPVSCGLNGFELSQTMRELSEPGSPANIASFLLILMFTCTVVGAILLIYKKHSLPLDWGIFLTCIGSGLIAYLMLRGDNDLSRYLARSTLDGGAYFIIIGWITGGLALIIASGKPEIVEPSKSFQNEPLKAESEVTPNQSIGVTKIPQVNAESFDFSDIFVPDWPVELVSGNLSESQQPDRTRTLQAQIFVKNVQNRAIAYMHWELICFDLLNKPILTEIPVSVRHEEIVEPGKIITITIETNLPRGTKSFNAHLKAVLYTDGRIQEFTNDVQKVKVSKRKTISDVVNRYDGFIEKYSDLQEFNQRPEYLYEIEGNGSWICAFCGTRNIEEFSDCRLCGTGIDHQKLCTEEVLMCSYEPWKKNLQEEQKEEEEERKRVEQIEKERVEQENEERRRKEELQAEKLRIKKENLSRKRKKILKIFLITLAVIAVFIIIWATIGENFYNYQNANYSIKKGWYQDAYITYQRLDNYKDSKQKAKNLVFTVTLYDPFDTSTDGSNTTARKIKVLYGSTIYNYPYLTSNRVIVQSETAPVDEVIVTRERIINTGYTFNGWYKDAELIHEWDYESDKVLSDTTLYAKWNINRYQVIFDYNDFVGGNTILENVAYGSSISAPEEPVQPWGSFEGWYEDSSYIKKYNFETTNVYNNMTLYAKWAGNTNYEVVLDWGDGNKTQVTATYGEAMPYAKNIMSEKGKFLEGFFDTEAVGGAKYYDGTMKSVRNWDKTSATTLYARTKEYQVGDIGPAGGYIFYDKGDVSGGWKYLESAPVAYFWKDKVWGGYGTELEKTGTAIGTGANNTKIIVEKFGGREPYQQENDYAAKLCDDLKVANNGVNYDDWFLPSKDELDVMCQYIQKERINGFIGDILWSSSNYFYLTTNSAWSLYFGAGNERYRPSEKNRYATATVRPVRAF